MAKKKDILQLLQDVFGSYPGSKLLEPLRDGACLQGRIAGKDYKLEKRYGKTVICDGVAASPDISVEMNRAAAEYLAGSEEPADFVARARECIAGTHDDCSMSYEIHAGLPRMLMKGYLDFARMLGII